MWHQKTLRIWSDLVDDSIVFTKHELQLIVVGLELFLLEKYNFCTFGDFDTDTRQALGLSNESKDLCIEIDVQLVVVRMSDDEGGKQTCLCFFYLDNPPLTPFVFEVEESVGNAIVVGYLLDWLLGLLCPQQLFWEVLHGNRCSMEKVAGPSD